MYSKKRDRRHTYRGKLHGFLRCVLASAILGLCNTPTSAQCVEEQVLRASDRVNGFGFGGSVSVSGDTAVVGDSRLPCANGELCGSVYVYRFDGTRWVEEQALAASDAVAGSIFGRSVSVSGDTVVVSARVIDCQNGLDCAVVYVFRFNGEDWVEEQKLITPNAAARSRFTTSVSVSGDTFIVGAFDDCGQTLPCRSAYVYRFDGTRWLEEQKLVASDVTWRGGFGRSVSIDGDAVLVGAPGSNCAASASNCGSAYVFRFNGTSWIQEQKLNASGPVSGFGSVAALHGDTVVFGLRHEACPELHGSSCGSAYVFRFDGESWVEEQKLVASDRGWGDEFGHSVSVSGETIVIGAVWDDQSVDLADDRGSAYVFRFDGNSWFEDQKLVATDAARGDGFGSSVSVSGETVVVGAWMDRCLVPPGSQCGSAYMFSCTAAPTTVNLDIKPESCPNKVNPRSRGVMSVALVGDVNFDVAAVDADSLTLARADGVGGSVAPISERGGRGIVLKDVATPLDGELCECHDADRDGIDDLAMKFSTAEMSRAFQMNGLPRGTSIELVMRGSLQDGTEFEGVDCIVIPGSEPNSSRRYMSRRPK